MKEKRKKGYEVWLLFAFRTFYLVAVSCSTAEQLQRAVCQVDIQDMDLRACLNKVF